MSHQGFSSNLHVNRYTSGFSASTVFANNANICRRSALNWGALFNSFRLGSRFGFLLTSFQARPMGRRFGFSALIRTLKRRLELLLLLDGHLNNHRARIRGRFYGQ